MGFIIQHSGNALHINFQTVLTGIGVLMVNDVLTNLVNKAFPSQRTAILMLKTKKPATAGPVCCNSVCCWTS